MPALVWLFGAALALPAVTPSPAASPPPSAVASPAPSPAPSPTAKPNLTLEGTVVGPESKPIAGALVVARAASAQYFDPPLVARTDGAGRFRISVVSASAYALRIEATGLAAEVLNKVRPGTPLRIALARGGAIEGLVRDGSTGAPLGGAVVEARAERARGLGATWERGVGAVRATTDAKGQFKLEGIAAGLHTVVARARGFGLAQRRSVSAGARVELNLFAGGTLSGVVRGPDGRPRAGVPVMLETAVPTFPRESEGIEVSDAGGRFEFTGLEPGLFRVVARPADLAAAWTPPITVERGSEARVDLALDASATIVGRLVDGEERPVAGRMTLAETDGASVPRALANVLAAEAHADGWFRIERVPGGAHVLSATAPGFGGKRVEADVGARQTIVDVGNVVLDQGLVIRGKVRDRAGQPVAEARVSGQQMRATMGDMGSESQTGADGTFAIGGLSAGTYEVSVNAPGFGTALREVEAGAGPVEFVLDAGGSITGLVVDEGGRPVESFRVNARPAAPSEGRRMFVGSKNESLTSAEGRFTLDDVTAGAYVLEVTAPEHATATLSNVKVAVGSATDVGRIQLTAGGSVRGTVVDATGTGIVGATVTVQGPSRQMMFYGDTSESVTDAAGAFEVRGAPMGTLQVIARHPAYAEGRSTVDVDTAKGPMDVRVVLTQGGRIEGRAKNRDGTALSGMVTVMPRAGGMPLWSSSSNVPIAPDGTFVAEHVASGPVRVNLMTGSGGRFTSSQGRDVDVREGETATVEFVVRNILVSGRVTRSGVAAPNLRLRVMGDGYSMMMVMGPPTPAVVAGPQRMTALTREDGSYEMLVDQPGKDQVTIESADGAVRYPGRPVEFPDADTFALDLDFASSPVGGIVVDQETDKPIPRANVFAVLREPKPGVAVPSTTTGADGRFQLEVEPGEYRVGARAEGYGGQNVNLSVSPSGASDVRFALSRGLAIAGRVVVRGQPVGGSLVVASPVDPKSNPSGGGAMSLPDGSFEISGLSPGDYNLLARSDLGLFGLRAGVTAGTRDVALGLRPGGRILLRVTGPDGRPVPAAIVTVVRVSGAAVSGVLAARGSADGQAPVELLAPAGTIDVHVAKDKLEGTAVVDLAEGGVADVEVRLALRSSPGTR